MLIILSSIITLIGCSNTIKNEIVGTWGYESLKIGETLYEKKDLSKIDNDYLLDKIIFTSDGNWIAVHGLSDYEGYGTWEIKDSNIVVLHYPSYIDDQPTELVYKDGKLHDETMETTFGKEDYKMEVTPIAEIEEKFIGKWSIDSLTESSWETGDKTIYKKEDLEKNYPERNYIFELTNDRKVIIRRGDTVVYEGNWRIEYADSIFVTVYYGSHSGGGTSKLEDGTLMISLNTDPLSAVESVYVLSKQD